MACLDSVGSSPGALPPRVVYSPPLFSAAAGNLRKLFVENTLVVFFSSPCASFKIPAISRIAWALSSHGTDGGFSAVMPQENYWATTLRVPRNIGTKIAVQPSLLRPIRYSDEQRCR